MPLAGRPRAAATSLFGGSHRGAAAALAPVVGCLAATALWLLAPAGSGFTTARPRLPGLGAPAPAGALRLTYPGEEVHVARRAQTIAAPDIFVPQAFKMRDKYAEDRRPKRLPKGWSRTLMKRMPSEQLTTYQMMQRIVTVLVRAMGEKWRDTPMKTLDIMKEIGCRGWQIKEKKHINKALYMLFGWHIIYKVKQNPIRWEIHEEYRENGVPYVSRDDRDPWKYAHLIKFPRKEPYKYGPPHGEYRRTKPQYRDGNTEDYADPGVFYPGQPR